MRIVGNAARENERASAAATGEARAEILRSIHEAALRERNIVGARNERSLPACFDHEEVGKLSGRI